jgi:hypothetical protein
MANFINLAASLPNDASHEAVGNIDLLSLHRLRRVVGSIAWVSSRNVG